LLWKLKKEVKDKKIELVEDWKYQVENLYEVSGLRQIIAGERILEKRNLDRLDFYKITILCFKHKIIEDEIVADLDKMRTLRNNLHIGSMKNLDKQYSDKDLEFAFSVAAKVKKIVSK